jgi:ABC-type multidrug transport system fused ATPase/permease subunit
LENILDFDRIAVMDAGKIVEYDSPTALMAKQSMFRALYDSSNRNSTGL